MNVKVILQVAYMSAFRPSFCINGSFTRVFKIFSHRQTDTQTHTHTGPITLPLRKRGVITQNQTKKIMFRYTATSYMHTHVYTYV